MRRRPLGIVLREVLALVVLGVLGFVLLVVALGGSRRDARGQWCTSQLAQIGVIYSTYAADFRESFYAFSWRAGAIPTTSDLPAQAATDAQAMALQAAEMIRGRAGEDFPPIDGWLPSVRHSPVLLGDYIAGPAPLRVGVCPADTQRLPLYKEQAIPPNPNRKGTPRVPLPLTPTGAARRWLFSSSYEFSPAVSSRDEAGPDGPTVGQAGTDDRYHVPDRIGPLRRITEVSFPAQKAIVYDTYDRHFAPRPTHFAHPEARQPVLHADASVLVRASSDADPGFQPNAPNAGPTRFDHLPDPLRDAWQPPPLSPDGDRGFLGRYRWTRGGLKGVDFPASVRPAAVAGPIRPATAVGLPVLAD